MMQNHKPIASLALLLLALSAPRCALGAPTASPTQSDLEQLLGHPMPTPIAKVAWATSEPAATNYPVYAVQPPHYDPRRLKALADFVGVKGEPVRMPDSLDIAPGYWIKHPNPTNSFLWTSVFFSEKTGASGYGIPDNGYRWDLKNHKPLVQGVPTHAEALQRALALLPVLGLTTNDLEVNSDGSLRRQFTKEVTGYNDQATKEHKEMLQKRSVILFQRVPGGETLSVGEGGAFEVAFISEGKLAEIGLLFRDLKPFASAKTLSSRQIIDAVRRGKAWTFRATLPASLTVTNCAVAYPQGNSSYRQKYLWPVYRVTGFGGADGLTNTFSILVPLDAQ
jgi:hypothetical protein